MNQPTNKFIGIGFTVLLYLSLIIISYVYTSFLTHRLIGPTVAIKRFVQDLNAGRLEQEFTLRNKDELQDIVDDLNKLRQVLKDRISNDD